MNTVNPQLVEQISSLVEAWRESDQLCQKTFKGWQKQSIRAGLEEGFYLQVGLLNGVDEFLGIEFMNRKEAGKLDYEAYMSRKEAGKLVYEAYMRGEFVRALDLIHS